MKVPIEELLCLSGRSRHAAQGDIAQLELRGKGHRGALCLLPVLALQQQFREHWSSLLLSVAVNQQDQSQPLSPTVKWSHKGAPRDPG